MIVAIHQPQYLPWIPYVDKADQADVFVYLDTVQFARRGVQQRNQIKSCHGPQWLSVPVNAGRETAIKDVLIAENPWLKSHIRSLSMNYARSAHAEEVEELAEILTVPRTHLVDLNIAVTEWIFEKLGVKARRVRASELGVEGTKQNLMISITKAVGGRVYLSGRGASVYQAATDFLEHDLELKYQTYCNVPYPQCFPETGFCPDLSAVDLIFNTGRRGREILQAGRDEAEPEGVG